MRREWTAEREALWEALCEEERLNLGRELEPWEKMTIWERLDPPDDPQIKKVEKET